MANENISIPPIVRGLVSIGYDEKSLLNAVNDPERKGLPIPIFLVKKNLVNSRKMMNWLSSRYNIPMVDLDAVVLNELVIQKLDRSIISKNFLLPLSIHRDKLYVATADPMDLKAFEEAKFNSGMQISPILAEADKLIKLVENFSSTTKGKLQELFSSQSKGEEEEESNEFDLSKSTDDLEDGPVVRFVQQLLLDAIEMGVSDIHLEPYEKDIRVRYRIDGILQDVLHPPFQLREGVTSRLKILCKLDIAERRLPQDGRLRVRIPPAKTIDFRVSFLPSIFGETIVLRLLDPSSSKVPIESLGFLPEQRKFFEEAIKKPYGMVLVTGPTGSGKTTTLYTALNILNTGDVNISTAEDPVEIPVYGINQVNANDAIGLTFATILRSFLRQDPDIIMVGEIRDLETAETAIKAAQTGHLVLATLHTNDAPQTLTRLENMGIPGYNIASAVHLVMAQRLVRKLCPHCRAPERIPEQAMIQAGFSPDELQGWRPMGPVGCEKCGGTGYKGRIGIYQIMPVSEPMREIIMKGGNSMDIARQAKKDGVLSMRESGLIRVKDGTTSLEEVLRVTDIH